MILNDKEFLVMQLLCEPAQQGECSEQELNYGMMTINPALVSPTGTVNSLLAIQHTSYVVYHTFWRGFLEKREQQLAIHSF